QPCLFYDAASSGERVTFKPIQTPRDLYKRFKFIPIALLQTLALMTGSSQDCLIHL
ncbi:MAG: hypothetical protein JWO19_5591, partial [Bryobacterales bacterium]|nr:hypothetical protein [Bryobacterales bacterium]